ncbi:MAG: serine--tRNA ligase [Bacillota bacterium]
MLDLKLLRTDPDLVRRGWQDKGAPVDLDSILVLDAERRSILTQAETLKARRNQASANIAAMRRAKDLAAAEEAAAQTRKLGQDIKELDSRLAEISSQLEALLLEVPNLPHASVPRGADDRANVEVSRWGQLPSFEFDPLPHWELAQRLDIIDFERASKVAGTRFALLKGPGALLERALINFMLDLHTTEHQYVEIFPPFMVNREAMVGTGQLPKFEEDMFRVVNNGMFMVPTAEVPVTNIHRDEILGHDQLPRYYAAYSACFRAEAGASGRDTRGLIRNHQFNKVELVKFTRPETSYDELERLTRDAQVVLERLGLPYRTVCLSTGDMSFASAKTYDLEVWLPSSNAYREISSCSNFEEFQARRANIRFRPEPGARPEYVHTLNGSGVAVGRAMAAILENYQNADGSVTVPEALRPYMRGLASMQR